MKLYKYIGLESYYGPANCKAILQESKIWTSSFQRLNDPFEYRFLLKDGNDSRHSFTIAIESSRKGIMSFSSTNSDLLLWSHYGTSHRGICFEFDSELDDTLRTAREVTYSPIIPTYDSEQPDQILLSKFRDWSYEKEFRVITHNLCDTHFTVNRGCLTAVYFGLNVNLDDVKEFDPACQELGVKRYQAHSVQNDYRIGFKEINRPEDYDAVIKKAALGEIIRRAVQKMAVKEIVSNLMSRKH